MVHNRRCAVFCCLSFCLVAALSVRTAFSQESNQSSRAAVQKDEEVNLDIQLYLILASNREVEETRLPIVLDPIVKQLRDSLAFKHYNLAATFLNRVKNRGKLDVSWIGGPFAIHGSPATSNPSFSQFTSFVILDNDSSGHQIVQLNEFRFGTKVPIIVGQSMTTVASINGGALSTINYEPVGLRTDLSLREGSTVIAGTLNVGPSGDALVVVISAKRAAN
jgi:hypothetical protein